MKNYVRERAAELLERLEGEVGRVASSDPDPDAVHDLRVSIRRFGRCLRAFSQFYPKDACKRIQRRLRGLMDMAAAVRDRDIALELLGAAGIPADAPAMDRLRRRRARAHARLCAEAGRWRKRGFAPRWRKGLEL